MYRLHTPSAKQSVCALLIKPDPLIYFILLPALHPGVQLALNRRRTRVGVAGGDGPVQLEQDARVGGLVGAGERDQRARVERARAARDGELRARDVELGPAGRAGAVQRDVLGPQQVVAVGDALGDLDGYFGLAYKL
jgi:hypothetical protein